MLRAVDEASEVMTAQGRGSEVSVSPPAAILRSALKAAVCWMNWTMEFGSQRRLIMVRVDSSWSAFLWRGLPPRDYAATPGQRGGSDQSRSRLCGIVFAL